MATLEKYGPRKDPDQDSFTIYPKIYKVINSTIKEVLRFESGFCDICIKEITDIDNLALLEIDSDFLGLIEKYYHYTCIKQYFKMEDSS